MKTKIPSQVPVSNIVTLIALTFAVISGGPPPAQATNYIVVARVGDGVQTMTSGVGNSLFLDEFTPIGVYVGTINVPNSGASALIADASPAQQSPELWTSLRLSSNGEYLTFPGFNVPYPSSQGLSSASASVVPRGIGRVDANGEYALAISDNGLYNGATFRSAVSSDGSSQFWTSGGARGVKYLNPPNADVQVSPVSGAPGGGNVRDLGIFNGVLYASTQAGTNFGLYTFNGVPIGADTPSFVLSYNPTNSHPDEFAVSPDGETIYLADDGVGGGVGGGIERWDNDGLGWTLSYVLPSGDFSGGSPVGARGLAVDFSNFSRNTTNMMNTNGVGFGSGAVIYATTAELFGNQLISITDDGPSSPAVILSQLTTTNEVYRGVSLWPYAPSSSTNCYPAPSGLIDWWPGNGNTEDIIGGDNGIWVQSNGNYTSGQNGYAFSLLGFNYVTTSDVINNPPNFTVDLWFNTTNFGGVLFGFAGDQSDDNGQFDRTLYMDSSGFLNFGVWTGSAQIISSTAPYNDGQWHNVAASESANGAVLYVDGVLQGSNPNATPGENFTGYWRIGDNGLTYWPDQPASTYFEGAIDQVLLYDRPLLAQEVASVYEAGPLGGCPSNTCITLSCSNIVVYACSCTNVNFTNAVSCSDACCSNQVTLSYNVPITNCFEAPSTNTIIVTATDVCDNVVSKYFTVTVLPYSVTVVVPSGSTALLSNPFNNGNNSANILFPNPDPEQNYSGPRDFDLLEIYSCGTGGEGITGYGTYEQVYFDSVTNDTPTGFIDVNTGLPVPAPILSPGCGFAYENQQTYSETNVFAGCPGNPGDCFCGCGLWSFLGPVGIAPAGSEAASYQAIIGSSPVNGSEVSLSPPVQIGTSYVFQNPDTYFNGVWSPSTPVVTNGQAAFFYVPCCLSFTNIVNGTNKIYSCGTTNWAFDNPQPSDLCCSNPVVSFAGSVVSTCPLVLQGTWVASDSCSNEVIAQETLTIPCCGSNSCMVIGFLTNKTVPCGTNWSFNQPVVLSDPCCTNHNYMYSMHVITNSSSCPQVLTAVWQIFDACGDSAVCTQTVTLDCCTNCVPPPANMVLWLPFDETSGNISANLATPADPGTQVNNPTPWLGQFVDNSLSFNGTNYVTVPDYPGIDIGSNSLTIDAWVSESSPYLNVTNVILSKLSSSVQSGYALLLNTNQGLTLIVNGQSYTEESPIFFAPNQWHFVAVTLNQGTQTGTFYVDGQAVGNTFHPPAGNLSDTNPLWVASAPFAFQIPFNNIGVASWLGRLDEVEVYNRALSATEINEIYSAGQAGKCKPCIPTLLLTNYTIVCNGAFPTNKPGYTDTCCSNVNVSLLFSTTNGNGCTTVVTQYWQAVDMCYGTTNTGYRTITTLPSTPTLLMTNYTIACNGPFPTNQPGYTDPCCGNVSVSPLFSTTNGNGCTTVVTQYWQAVDLCCGTTNTGYRTITTLPSTPTLLLSNYTIACNAPFPTNQPGYTDPCCSAVNVSLLFSTTNGNGCTTVVTQYWQAVDLCCGTTNTGYRTITTLPSTPTLLLSNYTIACNAPFPTNQPAYTDPCCNAVSVSLLSSITNNSGCPIVVTQFWQAVDLCCFTTNIGYRTITIDCCTTNCVPPPTNMVLWLPFDETSGNISANLAAPADPGTQINNPTPWLGQYVDNSLSFNGTNYVNVPDYSAIDIGSNSLTIDAWVSESSPTLFVTNVILSKVSSSVQSGYALLLNTNQGLTLIVNGQYYTEESPIVFGTNQWHFVAVTLNQSTQVGTFYVDGQAVGNTFHPPAGNLSDTNPLWVASAPFAFRIPFFNGSIASWLGELDEVEVYNRALSATEINEIYSAGQAGKCKPCLQVTCPSTNIVMTSCTNAPAKSLPQPIVTDPCCTNPPSVSYSPPGPFAPGTQTFLTYIISDCMGNTDICQSVVTINPGTNCGPCLQVTCPSTNIVMSSCTNVPAKSLPQPIVTDSCCTNPPSVSYSPPGPFAPGTQTFLTYIISDCVGNTDICQSVVTINPGTNCGPCLQVTCPSTNIVMTSCTNVPAKSLPQPIVTDSCCTNPPSVSYSPPGPFAPGTQTFVTYIISDCVGNTDICQSVVTINPGTNCGPCLQVTCPSTNIVVVSCTNVPAKALPQPIVTDSCCTNPPTVSYSPPGPFAPGTQTFLTYIISDCMGNTDICESVVTIEQGNCTNCTTGFNITNFTTNVVVSSQMQLFGSAAAGVIDAVGNTVLRLTPAVGSVKGSAFVPVTLGDDLSFNTEFSFQMTNASATAGADGIVFVLATAPGLGHDGGGAGYEGLSHSVGVKFDTYQDSGVPYNDPNNNFVAIYTDGSVDTTGYVPYSNPETQPQYYTPSTPMKDSDIWYAWIDYNGLSGEMDVYLKDNSSVRPATPQLSQLIGLDNLSILGFGSPLFAGFTAATGSSYEDQDILTWTFSSPCTNTCALSIVCSNIVAYTCDTNCMTVPITVTTIDTCCSNTPVLQYLLGTNLISPTNYCFAVNSTNTVTVVASDACGNVVTNYFTVTLLYGPGNLHISYQVLGNNVILTWPQGILQAMPTTTSLADPHTLQEAWSDVPGATSPYVTKASGATTFYRLRCRCQTCDCLVLTCPSNIVITTCALCTNVPVADYVGVEDNCCTNWSAPVFYPTNHCFAPNTTNTVYVSVTDSCGYTASNSFQVIVLPCAGATNCLSLNCPGTIEVGTCTNTAIVNASATVTGCTNGVTVTYTALGGYSYTLSSFPFPVGTNEVTVLANYEGDTVAECYFYVIVTNRNCNGSGPMIQWTFGVSQPDVSLAAGVEFSNIAPELGTGTASALHQGATTYSSPVGNGTDHSFSANNWTMGDYFQFAGPTTNITDISVAWDQLSSGTGPGWFQLEYSVDGVNFYDAGPFYAVSANGTLSGPLDHWSSDTNDSTTHYEQDLSSISALANASQVWFRLVDVSTNNPGGGAVGPFGTSRVSNFTLGGLQLVGQTPEVTWSEPAPITYGTPLGEAQQDAMSTVPGTFTYTPPAGTVLSAGSNVLTAVFTPSFSGFPATNTVKQLVLPRILTVSADNATQTGGETNPIYTGVVVGAVSNDNINVTWTSSVTATSSNGQYSINPVITANPGRLLNYIVVTNPGTTTLCGCHGVTNLWWTFEISRPSGSELPGVPITGIYPESGSGVASSVHQGACVYSHPSGNGSTNSFCGTNWTVGDYFQFACSNVTLCFDWSVAWDQTSSYTGPGEFQLQYSFDGVNFTEIGQPYQVQPIIWNYYTFNPMSHHIQNLSSISGTPGIATVWFRLVDVSEGSADGNTVGPFGTDRVDNFRLTSTEEGP